MRKKDKEITRKKILDAAMDVFSDKGYNDALVDDIAKQSDTSKGAFYFHFPSKKALFQALLTSLVRHLIDDVEQAIEHHHGALNKIEAAIDTVLATFTKHEKATRLLLVEATGLGKAFDREIHQAHEQFARLIAKHLQAAIDDGSIEPIPVMVTAYAWFGAIYEVLFMTLLSPEHQSLETLVGPLRDLLLKSIAKPSSKNH